MTRTSTLSFTNKEEAINWFSSMEMRMVRQLPASYVGVCRGDEGEKIDMVAIKCGLNEYELTEVAR